MKVLWKTDPELSALHAAAVVAAGGAVVDAKFEAALGGPVAAINERLEMSETQVAEFWRHLLTSSGAEDAARVETALLAAGCPELVMDSVATAVVGRLADARLALGEQFPKLRDQLPLRARPLRELWEAHGPGLLRELGRRTSEKIIPPRTMIHLVQPVRGGDGGLLNGSGQASGAAVWIEAMLTHPDPAIPETLRLAWLIARSGMTRGAANRWVEPHRLPRAAALALLPITLAGGESLGICDSSDTRIAAAAELWHVGREHEAESLIRWWDQMRQGELPLPVAIKALDKMLG